MGGMGSKFFSLTGTALNPKPDKDTFSSRKAGFVF